ncbi:hypothetical protein HC341_06765 [Aquisalimonas sp. 2447]|uniref:hypothetical protein n=1 Tax=Aquisalimonas sp. 2447 TaxID=2740807 RepID=UPI00143271DF|nr:hypothetical protein [Aquisalimonas sp. 2447]QIT54941.1 hypothetical protein HC341_06765 [Aquisalimonas sp. 2447]
MFEALKSRLTTPRRASRSRNDVLAECSDLARLDRLRRHARDRDTRQRADARYRALLVGGDASLRLEDRVAAVQVCTDDAVLAYVARSAREEIVRRAALDRLDSDRVLMEVALNDPIARLRRRAVAMMNDPELLQNVLHRGHPDDPRIARDAGRRLRELQV